VLVVSDRDERIGEILEKVQQRDEERVIEIQEHTVQLVVFLLGERYYAFHGDHIKEIVPVTDITYVPGMPDYLLGVINVRGEIESVLDLRSVLSLPAGTVANRAVLLSDRLMKFDPAY
jgi:purine-binding chemotaxis protein CheW